jgi:NAD(P)-dependent dehydrogenase (short-subunit alcohol dehydrogenase family)
MKTTGNTVLITGGATGIGFALAEAFLGAGNEVIICGRRRGKLAEARKKLPGLHVLACDVAAAVMESLRTDEYEIAVGMARNLVRASMTDPKGAFQRING